MKKTLLFLFLTFITQISFAQTYDNGGFATGPNHTTGTVAPSGYSWSELEAPNTSLGVSGFYLNDLTSDFAIADDFVVPTGETWDLSKIKVYAYQTNNAGAVVPMDVLRIRIWNGDPAVATSTIVFGDMTTNRLSTESGEAFVFRTGNTAAGTTRKVWELIGDASVTLTPGTYWLEYQIHATNNATAFFPPLTTLGSTSNPLWNAKQRSVATWTSISDGGSTNPLGLPFKIDYALNLSINENQLNTVSIYPNPVNDVISLSSVQSFNKVQVLDLNGRIMKRTTFENVSSTSLNVSDLASGVYFLNISTDSGSVSKKFMKN